MKSRICMEGSKTQQERGTKMEIQVSLIVPVYNTERYLEECVESLLKQTLAQIEIILVDDGSTDSSAALCDRLAARDPRVSVIHKKNEGLGQTRNCGILRARGEYVGFVDSDDYVLPDMYEKLYQAAKREDADIALAGMRHVGGNLFEHNGEQQLCCFSEKELFEGEEGRKRLIFGIVGAKPWEKQDSRYNFSVCKNLYRKRLITKRGLLFENRQECEDLFFLIRAVAAANRAVGIPGAFYCYRRTENSICRAYQTDLFERAKKMTEAVEAELKRLLPNEDAREYTDRMFQARARVALVSEIQNSRLNGGRYFSVKQRLEGISSDEKLQEVLRRYPYRRLPKKQAVFAFAMRFKLTYLEYLLVVCKEKRG